jgi:RNA polymerase sigma-70 factor (ECF subfamily)
MAETVAEVVEACQRGDRSAQHRLYELTHQNVYRLMVRMVGLQEAADLTQQVFLQVFRKIGQFSGRAQVGTWIYRLAANEALQHLRRAKRSRVQVLQHEPEDQRSNPGGNIDDKEVMEAALASLELDLRATFLLREVEGLSYGEIARTMQIPEGTVGSRMNRARRELKKYLVEMKCEL